MLASDVKVLQGMPMFRDVEPAKLKLIALASERANYRPGDRLLSAGGRADSVFVILEGSANVLIGEGAAEISVAKVGLGDVVGEIGVVLDRPYSGTIVAETQLAALRIDKRTFLDLLAQVPQFSLAVIRELANRLLATNERFAKAVAK
jgi:CRP-like cAMP-binding protein